MKTTLQPVVRVSEFYARLFEIKQRVRTEQWAELPVGGTNLRLLKADQSQKQVEEDTSKTSPCYLGVETDDLDAFHSKIVALGSRCVQPPLKQQNGDRIAIYDDPDGLACREIDRAAAIGHDKSIRNTFDVAHVG